MQDASEPAQQSGGEQAFWDKQVDLSSGQVPVKPDMQPAQPAADSNFANLLKNAHKQQTPPPSQSPRAPQPGGGDTTPPLLPPSFFQSQQAAAVAGTAAQAAPAQDNIMQKLFANV